MTSTLGWVHFIENFIQDFGGESVGASFVAELRGEGIEFFPAEFLKFAEFVHGNECADFAVLPLDDDDLTAAFVEEGRKVVPCFGR